MAKRKDWLIGLGVMIVTLVLIMIMVMVSSLKNADRSFQISSGGSKVALVELEGPIYESKKIVRQIERFGEQKSIKAIIFRINSPGGGVAQSQEIYDAVRKVRDSGKPVVASMGSVAASGGYYVACGSDTIMANPGTTTGSIGVVAEFMSFKELFKKIGIHIDVVKSGRFKDSGSPFRPLSPAERQYFQDWVNDAYDQFVGIVAEERGLTKAQTLRLADGKVFTGRQAVKNGLVDCLGDYKDAIQMAARMAGIEGEPTVVQIRPRRKSIYSLFMEQAEEVMFSRSKTTLKYIFQ